MEQHYFTGKVTVSRKYDVKDYGDVVITALTPERSPTSGIIAEDSLISMTQGVQQR